MNRGQLAHEQSQNRARREPVAFVSINQIAESATLHSNQPFLFAVPPNHTPPLSLPLPPFSSGSDRPTVRVTRLSERKTRQIVAHKWKQETKANRNSKRSPKQTMLESPHEDRCASRYKAAQEASTENKDKKDRKPIGHAHRNHPNDAQTRRQRYSHSPKYSKRNQHRKNKHVVGIGGGEGRDDAARFEPDHEEDEATGRATHQRTSRGESASKSSRLRRGDLLLIPQFCPHRPGTVVKQQGMETCDWSIRRTAAHTGPDNYRMCPYGPRSHIRRLRFSALFCVSPRKSRYRNDCGPVAHLTRTGSEENLKKKKNLESARNWPLESQ